MRFGKFEGPSVRNSITVLQVVDGALQIWLSVRLVGNRAGAHIGDHVFVVRVGVF